jgi:hypothetical protein
VHVDDNHDGNKHDNQPDNNYFDNDDNNNNDHDDDNDYNASSYNYDYYHARTRLSPARGYPVRGGLAAAGQGLSEQPGDDGLDNNVLKCGYARSSLGT